MKINSIPTVRFSSIYAISAKPNVMERISKKCDNYSPDRLIFMSATGIYKNSDGDGFCHNAVNNENNEVAFLVVGKEDCDKVTYMESGYGSSKLNGISQHLEEGFKVDNIEDGEQLIDDLLAKEQQPPCHQDCASCFYTEDTDEI